MPRICGSGSTCWPTRSPPRPRWRRLAPPPSSVPRPPRAKAADAERRVGQADQFRVEADAAAEQMSEELNAAQDRASAAQERAQAAGADRDAVVAKARADAGQRIADRPSGTPPSPGPGRSPPTASGRPYTRCSRAGTALRSFRPRARGAARRTATCVRSRRLGEAGTDPGRSRRWFRFWSAPVTGAGDRVPRREFIYCSEWDGTPFAELRARLEADPEWHVHVLPTGHDAMHEAPEATAALLLGEPVAGTQSPRQQAPK